MERVGKTLKKQSFRKVIIYFLTCCMVFNTSLPAVLATPANGVFKVGTGTINDNVAGGDNTVLVNQLESVIEWGSQGSGGIDTSASESLSFSQASGLSNSAVLNRIMSGSATQFDGTLNGLDMRIFIVNPAGIVFGDGAIINVSQLVASSLDVSNFHDIATDVTRKMEFTDGAAAGSVEIQGVLDASNTGSLYFVGKSVTNNGSILCPNGLVVMAAGNAVQLGQPGSNVIVTLADLTADSGNVVDNSGTVGTVSEPVGKLVLAAGDVWSQAISNVKKVKIASVGSIGTDNLESINAYSNGGSDAVATVDIVSGGDIYVDDDVTAEADAPWGFNSSAAVTIDAGNNVFIDDAEVWADASDGVTNTATTNITANDGAVEVTTDDGYAEVGAYATDGFDNIAKVNITAKSLDTVNPSSAYVYLEADYGEVYVGAEAEGAENSNSADVTINADYDVELYAYDDSGVYVEAYADNNYGEYSPAVTNDAGITVNAGSYVEVRAESDSDADIYAEASYGIDNSATVDVTANNGDVYVEAYNDSDAYIETYASNDDESNTSNINITAGGNVEVLSYDSSESTVYAEAEDGITNNASVDITAGADVRVQADGYGSYGFAGIEAEVYATDGTNTATNTVNAGGKVVARADSGGEVDIDSESWYGSTNKATTTINAGDYVKVKAVGMGLNDQEQPIASDAAIEAEAWDSYNNTANVNITVTGEAQGSHSGMVRVIAEDGGQAEIEALARNDGNVDDYTDLTVVVGGTDLAGTIQGITNTAKVDIKAKSVEVSADNSGSSAFISSNVGNEIRLDNLTGDLSLILGSITNDAEVLITTAEDDDGDLGYQDVMSVDNGDVSVIAQNDSMAGIDVEAYNEIYDESNMNVDLTVEGPILNYSDIVINAGDDVMTVAIDSGDAEIDTEAWNEIGGSYSYYINLIEEGPVQNSAGVDITTGQDVVVISSNDSWANIGANTWNESSVLPAIFPDTKDNVTTVNINAGGGVGVLAEYDSEAQIGAGAEFATTNTSTVTIDAVGPVEVEARDGSKTNIIASTQLAVNSNTSDIEINADNVGVHGNTNSDAAISAEAYSAYDEDSENTANVAVYTHAADVELDNESGDVLIEASEGGGATIQAMTSDAYTNTSDVLVCADGDVRIYGTMGGDADILADAMNAYSNTAKVGVGARGDEGVVVRAEDGTAFIEAWAQDGYTNTAETIVYTKGGVQIVDKSPVYTSAGIIAEALNGYYTDAYIGVRAEDDIMVMAGIGPEELESLAGGDYQGTGGHAEIKAEASSVVGADEETSANAETVVYSLQGGVAVMDAIPTGGQQIGTAEITSSASGGETNTAYTGVYAGGDLLNEDHPVYDDYQGIGVAVVGIGDNSEAKITSETFDGYMNTSDTVVCTPAEVIVEAEDLYSIAEIGASADDGVINTATTQVYAGDVYVYNPNYYLSGEGGIFAYAQGLAYVPYLGDSFILTEYDGEYGYHYLNWIEGGAAVEDEDTAHLRIGDYSKRRDCPECPVSPCDEPIKPTPTPTPKPKPMGPFIPAAPLPERLSFEISGYPALMSWVAKELGVDTGSIQIGVTNSLASAKDIQPFSRFTRLRAAATILQDAGGAYMNALAQVIYEYASSSTPPTEEQMASIADAIASNAGANNQYALAGKYLDALTEYVGILSDEMGFTKEQAVQMVIERYVNRLTESDNPAVAAYLAARLGAMGG